MPELDRSERRFRVWPFEGSLAELLSEAPVVLAELYPRAAYAVALAETLPAPPLRLAKTRPAARRAALARLSQAAWLSDHGLRLRALAEAEASEDVFDALLSVVALVRLVDLGQPLASAWVDPAVEGGILGHADPASDVDPATSQAFG